MENSKRIKILRDSIVKTLSNINHPFFEKNDEGLFDLENIDPRKHTNNIISYYNPENDVRYNELLLEISMGEFTVVLLNDKYQIESDEPYTSSFHMYYVEILADVLDWAEFEITSYTPKTPTTSPSVFKDLPRVLPIDKNGANIGYFHGQLKFDAIEKLGDLDAPIEVHRCYFDSKTHPYEIYIAGDSYFYEDVDERNKDYETLQVNFPHFSFKN